MGKTPYFQTYFLYILTIINISCTISIRYKQDIKLSFFYLEMKNSLSSIYDEISSCN